MSVVTRNTAFNLKAAGLPQPEVQRGQAWYFAGDLSAEPAIVISVAESRFLVSTQTDGGVFDVVEVRKSDIDRWIFAPSTADILNDMCGSSAAEIAAKAWFNEKVKDIFINPEDLEPTPG